MNELEKIADQLMRAVEGNAWHGPALLEILNNVTAEQAASHPVKNIHSIWEILNHITAWQKAITERMDFKAKELDGEDDWPPVNDKSPAAWEKSIAEFKASYKSLLEKILTFPSAKLNEIVPGKNDQTFYILLHGIIQHNLYHAGQIAIIKKSLFDFL